MKNIHDYTDLFSIAVGIVGSMLKAMKRKLPLSATIIQMIVGAILAYGTVGVIDQFFGQLNERIVIVVSFAVGWAANEITDQLDRIVRDLSDKYIVKGKNSEDENA